jgi:hypothetical protein
MEECMSALIAIAALLVVLANGLFALHIWSGLSDPTQSPMGGR